MLNYRTPNNIEEATETLGAAANPTILSGGTVGMPIIAKGGSGFDTVIDISKLGLDEIRINGNEVVIGAYVKLSQLSNCKELAFLSPAVNSIAGPAIRNLATVGGNIFCHGDLASAFLALDAEVVLHSAAGESGISLDEFYQNSDNSNVILTEIKFSLPENRMFGFSKFSRRKLNSSAILSIAICEGESGSVLIGLVGAADRPKLLRVDGNFLGEAHPDTKISELMQTQIIDFHPPTDSHASGSYRKQMIPIVIKRAMNAALAKL